MSKPGFRSTVALLAGGTTRTSRLPSSGLRVSGTISLRSRKIVHPLFVGADEDSGRCALLDLARQPARRREREADAGAPTFCRYWRAISSSAFCKLAAAKTVTSSCDHAGADSTSITVHAETSVLIHVRHFIAGSRWPTTSCSLSDIGRLKARVAPAQCASSQLAPTPSSTSSGTRNCATPAISAGTARAHQIRFGVRHLEHQFVVHLHHQPRAQRVLLDPAVAPRSSRA